MLISSEIRSAITLILALGAVASAWAADGDASPIGLTVDSASAGRFKLAAAEGTAADTGSDTQQADNSKAKTSLPENETAGASPWGAEATGTLLGSDSGVSVGQQSITAGYELSGAGVASGLLPAQNASLTSPVRGGAVRFGNGIAIYPSAKIGFGRNDNLLATQSNKLASSVTWLSPKMVAELMRGGDRYTLSYLGNYASYSNATSDNYDHHEAWVAGDNAFSERLRVSWGVGYLEKSDARGSTNLGVTNEPNRWNAPVARILGIYGAPGAVGRVELESSVMQKRYENNRTVTAGSDVDISMVSGRFYYRFMPKTSVLAEVRDTQSNYMLGTSTQDNTDHSYFVGLTWEATAKTTGALKVGRTTKNFDSASRPDASAGSWEGSIRWAPLTYSTFSFVTGKSLADSTGVGNLTINTANNLSWDHAWASQFSSRLSAGMVKSDFVGAGVDRSDETRNYSFGIYRQLGSHLRLGVDWTRTNRTSNQSVNEFQRNVTMITLQGAL